MLGLVCKGDGGIPVEVSTAKPPVLDTAKACNATALRVAQGETYRISLKVTETWDDDGTATDPNGFDNSRAGWLQMLGWPYKRLIWSNWFATIFRVGGPGLEEHLLKFEEKDGIGRGPSSRVQMARYFSMSTTPCSAFHGSTTCSTEAIITARPT